jgi:hypothetical protein
MPPLTPASSLPGPGDSGALVYQSPGPNCTLMSVSVKENAALITAASVAPEMSPEGIA